MTIAVGVLSKKALIIGADSEEGTGYAGDFKRMRGKIGGVTIIPNTPTNPLSDVRALAVTGSGDSGYLAAIQKRVIGLFNDDAYKSLDKFDDDLARLVETFYKKHVIPFSRFQSMDLRVELIVGVRDKEKARLWVTNLNTIRAVDTFEKASIGSGSSWADTIMDNTFGIEDEQTLSVHVAHAIYVAKERAQGCGKETVICSLRPNEMMLRAEQTVIRRLEAVFREYRGVEEAASKYLAGWSPPDKAWTAYDANKVDKMRERIREISSHLYNEGPTLAAIRAGKFPPKGSPPRKSTGSATT